MSGIEIAAAAAGAKVAIDIANGAITLFDKLYPRIIRIVTGVEPKKPSIVIEKKGDDIVATRNGQELRRVNYIDLMNSISEDDLRNIRMYEQSLKAYERQVEAVYPQLATLPPIEKAQTELRLKQMTEAMRTDLLAILAFIQKIGFDLDDHYAAAYSKIEQFAKI